MNRALSGSRSAETIKAKANDEYKLKNYTKAIQLYSDAIELNPLPSYYTNRAAALTMLGKQQDAIRDCQAAVALDSEFVKVDTK